ncbi:ABC transporter permease [Devosia sp. XJ19-1]|uniref:ABC transporter permease n=1 Tax=Devosia ureilytica TaxID=2952754 RepID=A0A9Q4ALT5_9HYPH|nr:ABC transporter permease [Devosia ureilytica]MCP8885961.1 ABC transporter permease [Devosia ureilytica]
MSPRILGAASPFILTIFVFLFLAVALFIGLGQPPFQTLAVLVQFAVGDSYSLSQTMAKTTPILLCALAAAVPGRLGLISVGAEGQLHAGAIAGTALVLLAPVWPAPVLIPLMLIFAAIGGAIYGYIPGLLRARLDVNETIVTLLMNYVTVLLVAALVFGPWRDPASQGWPATMQFPPNAVLPALPGSRIHLGLLLGLVAALALHIYFNHSRWADKVRILAGNRKVGETFGLSFGFWVMVLMSVGGALAGLAGISEVSAIQGRLQQSISLGYGLTGFLVSWLSRHQPLIILPVSLCVGGLVAGSDALQMFAKVPAASAVILQGLLFAAALAVPGLLARWRKAQ